MGKGLHDAFSASREVFQEVDEALGETLSRTIFEGSEEELKRTAITQPALMAVSLAAMRALKAEFDVDVTKAAYVAGHSLGEYSALAAAGALSVPDAARLLRVRGDAMQAAVPLGKGAMAALLKVDVAAAEEIAKEGSSAGVVVVANNNTIGNVVISGTKDAVAAALEAAKAKGVRAIMLEVSAPFHSPLMQPAAGVMSDALAKTEIAPLAAPLVANVTARPVQEPTTIRKLLVEQVTGRVLWLESIQWMAKEAGVERFIEVGAGSQLSSMVKRADVGAAFAALNEPADLEAFAKTL